MSMNRRQALGAGAGGLFAFFAPTTSWAEQQKTDLVNIFQDANATDQTGKNIDVAAILHKGPAIVLFGYGGCPLCQKITDTVSAVQKAHPDVPIVVVSVQPETDRKSASDYVEKYELKKVKEYPDGVKEKTPENRLLHLVFTDTDEKAQVVQHKLAKLIRKEETLVSGKPAIHLKELTLFDDGDVVRIGKEPVAPEGVQLVKNIFTSNPEIQRQAVTKIGKGLEHIERQR